MQELTTTHHTFAPSSLERIESCRASWKICQGWQGLPTDDASRGSLLHRAIYDADAFYNLSDADKELIRELRREYIKKNSQPGFRIYYEQKVPVKGKDGKLLTEGTLDCLIISTDGRTALVIDWKFGNREVTPAERNIQQWAYVEGVFQMFPEVETVYAVIAQPIFGIGNYDNEAKFTRADEDRIRDRIEKAISNAQTADIEDQSHYNPTSGNCRYCNKINCFVYRQWMTDNMRLMGVDAEQLPAETKEMTLDYADKVKMAQKAITEAMKSTVEMADAFIIAQGGSEHFHMCEGRTTKKTDWKGLCAKHGITDEEVAEFTTQSQGSPYLSPRMGKRAQSKKLTN